MSLILTKRSMIAPQSDGRMKFAVFLISYLKVKLAYWEEGFSPILKVSVRHLRGLQHVRLSFTGDHLTRYGGGFLLHRFFHQMHLRRQFHECVRFLQRNNTYSIPEMLLALLYPIILGLGRLDTTELRRRNGVFQALTGLPAYPNPTTLRRFLGRFAVRGLPKLRGLHDELLQQLWQRPQPLRRVLFDLDSTVLTLYGHQEQARGGYNPRQHGRPSYVIPGSASRPRRGISGMGSCTPATCTRATEP